MGSAAPERIDLGGHSIAYRLAGEGPALVLLHGFLCDSRCWRTQLQALSDGFAVVAWDAPGAGASSDPPEVFTIGDWAETLAAFLDSLSIERAHLLGLSWGGLLAQEFARRSPARVQTLILADTYAGWRGSLPAEACAQRLARCRQESSLPAAEFARRWVPREFFSEGASEALAEEMAAIVKDFHPHGFRLMARTLAETDTRPLLASIEAPTLLVWGEHDQRSPLSIAERLCDAIPQARLQVIRNAGHVSNMEQPEQFNACVRGFCR